MSLDNRGFDPQHNDPEVSESAATPAPGKRTTTQLLQRRASGVAADAANAADRAGSGVAPGADAAVECAAASSGTALPAGLRAQFESSLATDLSGVRIHTGAASADAARALGARAYATGNDIHFAAGQYGTSDPFAVHLLAHEVAHTVQQSRAAPIDAGDAIAAQPKLEVSEPGDAAEREADHAADAMVAGAPARVSAAPSGVPRRVIQRDPEPNTSSSVAPSNNVPTSSAITGPEDIHHAMIGVPGAGAIIERLRPDLQATMPMLQQWRNVDGQVAALAQTAGIDPANAANPQLHHDVAQWRDQLAHNIAALPPAAANVQTPAQGAQVEYQTRFRNAREQLRNLQRNRIALHDASDAMLQGSYQVQAAQGAVDNQQAAEQPHPHNISTDGSVDLLGVLRGISNVLLSSFATLAVAGGELLTTIGEHAADSAAEAVNDATWNAALGRADEHAASYSREVQHLMSLRADAQAALAGHIATFRSTALACQNEWVRHRAACNELHAARQHLNIDTAALGAGGNPPGGAQPGSFNMTAALRMYNKMQDREQLALALQDAMADHAWTRSQNLGRMIDLMSGMVRHDVPDGTAWGRVHHSPRDLLLKFIEYPTWDALMPAARDQLSQLMAWSSQRPAQRAQFAQWQALLGPITAAPSGTADAPMAGTAAPPTAGPAHPQTPASALTPPTP